MRPGANTGPTLNPAHTGRMAEFLDRAFLLLRLERHYPFHRQDGLYRIPLSADP